MAMTQWNFIGVLSGAALWPLARTLSKAIESAEPVFGEVLNRGDAMRRCDMITTSRRAAEWPVRGSRKLGLEPLIC